MQIDNPRRFGLVIVLVLAVLAAVIFLVIRPGAHNTSPHGRMIGSTAILHQSRPANPGVTGIPVLPTGGPAIVVAARKAMEQQPQAVITVLDPSAGVTEGYNRSSQLVYTITRGRLQTLIMNKQLYSYSQTQHCYLVIPNNVTPDFNSYWSNLLPRPGANLHYQIKHKAGRTLVIWKFHSQLTTTSPKRSTKSSAKGSTKEPVKGAAIISTITLDTHDRISSSVIKNGQHILNDSRFTYPAQLKSPKLPLAKCRAK